MYSRNKVPGLIECYIVSHLLWCLLSVVSLCVRIGVCLFVKHYQWHYSCDSDSFITLTFCRAGGVGGGWGGRMRMFISVTKGGITSFVIAVTKGGVTSLKG